MHAPMILMVERHPNAFITPQEIKTESLSIFKYISALGKPSSWYSKSGHTGNI